MNRFAAFPAWSSAALLPLCLVTLAFAVSNGEQRFAWQVLSFFVHALMLTSFAAAFSAAENVWRTGRWLAAGYVLVSLAASWCLYVGGATASAAIDGGGHPVGNVIGAAIGFLFVPFSGIAAALGALKGAAAGWSNRTTLCGVGAGAVSIFGLIVVIPLSQSIGTEYGVAIVLLSLIGLALIGWWLGIGAAALRGQGAAAPSHAPPSP